MLYYLAKKMVKDDNPCAIMLGVDFAGKPVVGCRGFEATTNAMLCCGGFHIEDHDNICRYCGPNGCKVMSLRCALWYCEKCNYNEKMPHVTFSKDVRSITPIVTKLHLSLIKEMKRWRFDGEFRQGKGVTVESAYQSFKNGER
jgi:hypothetical protein